MILPDDLFRHFMVRHIESAQVCWVLGGDARYEQTGPMLGDYRLSPTGEFVLLRSPVHTHPWGWLARLDELEPVPDGSGRYHPGQLAVMADQLERTYTGSWRQHPDQATR